MSRFNSTGGRGHHIQRMGRDGFIISWTFDRYYSNCRLRFPTTMERWTDLAGAKRFAKKWGVNFDFGEDEQ